VRLVGLIRFMAEGGFSGVEGDHHPLRDEAFAVVEQSLEEAVGHRGGYPFLGAQAAFPPFAEGVEAAEGQ